MSALAGAGLVLLLGLILLLSRCGGPANAFEAAQLYAASGDMAAARVEAMNAVQADSGNEAAWLLLAETQIALNDLQSAISTIERAREAGVPAGRTRHLYAEAALMLGDNALALSETTADDIDPEFYEETALVRARTLQAYGDIQAAVQAFDYAIENYPDSDELWIDIAEFRIGTGEIGGAIEAADRAVELNDQNLEALVLKGRLARSQYGLVASLEWFARALAINPEYLPALYEEARTLGDIGRYSEMLSVTREILALDAGNVDALYLQAVMAARARKFRLARRITELIGEQLDEMSAMQMLQASIDYQENNYESAIRLLNGLLERQPANRSALRLLAAAYFRSGDMDNVIETLLPIADRGEADSYMLTLVGRALEREGEFEQAIPYLERAASPASGSLTPIGRRPETGEDLANLIEAVRDGGGAQAEIALIRAYLALGRRGDALSRAETLRNANPDAPDAHILYGDALGSLGRFGGAAGAYADAANIRFNEPVALRLVEALQRSGQQEQAFRALGLFRQQNPRNVATAMVSARLNLMAGRWQSAVALLEQIRTQVGDRDAAILANLAWGYHEVGETDRARALARRAYLLLPMNPATSEIYGWVLFDSEADRERGLDLMEKARSLAPDNPGIHWHLAQAYAALGRERAARTAAQAALDEPRFGAREEAEALLESL